MPTWTNWAGLTRAHPTQELSPHDAGEVADAVVAARHQHLAVKMPGTGHSFTDIAATDGLLLRPDGLRGVVAVDRENMTVTVRAGTTLREMNAALERLGLSLHNMGDIQEQTVAGAISTGTHGTGGQRASLSAQVSGLELVTGDGTLLTADATENADVLDVARVGLGALGVLTSVTFDVEPLFVLEAVEAPMRWDEALASFDAMAEENHHFEMYWFPHTDRLLTKRNNRTIDEAEPLSRSRAWFEDEFLSNRVFGWANRLGNARPKMIPRINAIAGRALGERRYSDVPHKVFTSHRGVVFREMEYAVPREVGLEALREVRAPARPRRLADQLPGRGAGVPCRRRAAVHGVRARHGVPRLPHQRADRPPRLLRGGRGDPARLRRPAPLGQAAHPDRRGPRARLPALADFQAMRDRIDPDRVFTNAYLERVLGP